jgi:hypothetical protein
VLPINKPTNTSAGSTGSRLEGCSKSPRVLNAAISYFYEGIGQEGPRQVAPHQRMLLEIARNFAEIRSEKHQEAVSHLARALASR